MLLYSNIIQNSKMVQNFESESTSIIARHVSDDNDTEDDIEEPMPKKRKGKNITYVMFKSYEILDDCLRELKAGLVENIIWAAKEVQKTEMDEKCYFKCTHCAKRVYILIHRMVTCIVWSEKCTFDGYLEWNDSHITNADSKNKTNIQLIVFSFSRFFFTIFYPTKKNIFVTFLEKKNLIYS